MVESMMVESMKEAVVIIVMAGLVLVNFCLWMARRAAAYEVVQKVLKDLTQKE